MFDPSLKGADGDRLTIDLFLETFDLGGVFYDISFEIFDVKEQLIQGSGSI